MIGIRPQKMNRAQAEAVLQTEGPLLIVAGAGTGKTRVITERILHLLLDKKVPASQILALTFTEKAAQEMLDRVDEGMPLSYEEVAIKTFHGFCDSLLRERGLEIGIDPGYKLFNTTDQWLFMKKNLFSFDLNYYRPLGNPSKFFFTLLNHFSRLKDEDIAPEAYVKHAEKLLNEAKDDAEREEAVKTLEIACAYRTYQDLMIRNNALDFGDLQYYALRLFEKRPSVLKECRKRFEFILVDEFQDTNYSQNKLVTMLAKEHRNLTVVGDDDQAIYKWRGASLSNILNFEKHFPEAKKVVLTENYRSTQEILDVSYAVIQNNNPYRLEDQEKIDKKLVSEKHGAPPEIWHFSSYLEEAQKIVETIHEFVRAGTYNYKDFAILVRANGIAGTYVDALKNSDIPFTVKSTEGLMRFDEIKDLLSLLRFLRNPYDDIAFFRLLSMNVFGLPMRLILDLASSAKKAGYEPMFKYLRDYLKKDADQGALPGISEQTIPFEPLYNLFNRLLDFSRDHSVTRVLGEFLDKSGYYKNLTAQDSLENAEKIQHIAQFIDVASGFETEDGEHSLRGFLEYLELLEEAQGTVETLPLEEADAVSILSCHASKGLEFEVVFMPSLVQNRFPSTNRRDPIEIPSALIAEELPDKDMHVQEERRLFYVGCTRARAHLYLSYSDFYEGRKKWKPSVFVEEARASSISEKDFTGETDAAKNIESSDLPANEGRVAKGLDLPPNDTDAKLLYLPEINVKNLSYSQLDTFATCPLKYKFRYLFNVPSPSAHAANFGSSVHNTLNEFYERVKKDEAPSPEMLQECYEKNWIPAGYDSKAHEQARKKSGWEILQNFYEKESTAGPGSQFVIPAYLEKLFRLKVGKFTFTGRIDRIDKLPDGTYEVVDYKTGSSKRDAKLDKDLQLSMYALACKEIFHIEVSKLSLYFLEDASKQSTTRNDDDLEVLKTELIAASDELQKSDFKPTPGFHCGFCEYKLLCHAAQ